MNGPSSQPLHGVRILDLTRVLSGPYCTALLADIGAEVIKVESAAGDDYRHIGPFRDGESLLFQSINRGKKSIILNLKAADDVARLKALALSCDVIVENFRPGVMDRLGLGHETLCAENSALVYASISGFGQTGPNARLPAYDIIIQAMSGLMSMTGEADAPPTMVGEALGDVAGGMFASWAIMVALFDRQRTGKGRYLDVSLFDSLLAMMPTVACMSVTADGDPSRTGNRHALSAPFGVYAAKEGNFALAVLNDGLFATLAATMGTPALVEDSRFTSDELRRQHEPALACFIERWAADRSPAEVVQCLSEAGIPASEISSARDAWTSELARTREMVSEVQHPTLGSLSVFEQPVKFGGAQRGHRNPAPGLGEHQDEFFSSESMDTDSEPTGKPHHDA